MTPVSNLFKSLVFFCATLIALHAGEAGAIEVHDRTEVRIVTTPSAFTADNALTFDLDTPFAFNVDGFFAFLPVTDTQGERADSMGVTFGLHCKLELLPEFDATPAISLGYMVSGTDLFNEDVDVDDALLDHGFFFLLGKSIGPVRLHAGVTYGTHFSAMRMETDERDLLSAVLGLSVYLEDIILAFEYGLPLTNEAGDEHACAFSFAYGYVHLFAQTDLENGMIGLGLHLPILNIQ